MTTRTIVSFIWNPKLEMYELRMPYIKSKTPKIVEIIKGLNVNKRDTTGPPDWIWYLHEDFYLPILTLLQATFEPYNIVFTVEKSKIEGFNQESFQSTVPDVQQELELLEAFIEQAKVQLPLVNDKAVCFRELPLELATKVYRKLAFWYHPDKNHSNAENMSKINAAWANLKTTYFKIEEKGA